MPQSFPIVSPIYSTSETLLVLSVPQSLHCSTEHVLFILWTLLCCKHFEHDPQLYNTPSPIILLLMYTWLIYSKNNFIANRLNVHLLCSRLIPCSSVSLNSHRTSFIMTLFLSLFDRWLGWGLFPLCQAPSQIDSFLWAQKFHVMS